MSLPRIIPANILQVSRLAMLNKNQQAMQQYVYTFIIINCAGLWELFACFIRHDVGRYPISILMKMISLTKQKVLSRPQ